VSALCTSSAPHERHAPEEQPPPSALPEMAMLRWERLLMEHLKTRCALLQPVLQLVPAVWAPGPQVRGASQPAAGALAAHRWAQRLRRQAVGWRLRTAGAAQSALACARQWPVPWPAALPPGAMLASEVLAEMLHLWTRSAGTSYPAMVVSGVRRCIQRTVRLLASMPSADNHQIAMLFQPTDCAPASETHRTQGARHAS
jgi:hypothetical protein